MDGADSGYASTDSAAQANAFLDELTLCVPAKPSMPSREENHTLLGSDLVHVKQESMAAPAWQQRVSGFGTSPVRQSRSASFDMPLDHVNQESMAAPTWQHTVSAFSTLPIREAPKVSLDINPERAAMIAATPIPETPNQQVRLAEGGGPLQSGMNLMPLGIRQPAGPSRSLTIASSSMPSYTPQRTAMPQLAGPKRGSKAPRRTRAVTRSMSLRSGTMIDRSALTRVAASGTAPATNGAGSGNITGRSNNHVIWQNLVTQIEVAIRDSAVHNPNRKTTWRRNVESALGALKPVILGKNASS